MSDYIKRKMAEVALGSMSMLDGKIFVEDAIAKISRLPSADVVERADYEQLRDVFDKTYDSLIHQRKRGEWTTGYNGWLFCSECKHLGYTTEHNFCPNCGADMRAGRKE